MLVVSFELFTLKFTKVCDNNSVQTDKSPDNVCLKLEFIRINRKKRTLLPVKKDYLKYSDKPLRKWTGHKPRFK